MKKKSVRQVRRRPRKRRRQRRRLLQTRPTSPRTPAQIPILKMTARTTRRKTKREPPRSEPKPLVRLPPPTDESRLTRRLLLRDQRTTCDLLFAVFLAMSIPVKQSCRGVASRTAIIRVAYDVA